MRPRLRLTVLVFISIGLGPAAADQKLERLIEQGRKIAKDQCARCHSINRSGKSKLPIAPAFRELTKRYSVRDLEEPLAEGIVTAHDKMPVFRFDPANLNALLTFMESLGTPEN